MKPDSEYIASCATFNAMVPYSVNLSQTHSGQKLGTCRPSYKQLPISGEPTRMSDPARPSMEHSGRGLGT